MPDGPRPLPQAEVDLLQQQLGSSTGRSAKLEAISARCVEAYSRASARARGVQQLVQAWALWRQAVREARELRRKEAVAARWHRQVLLTRRVFEAWRRLCLGNQQALAQKRADAQVAAARAQLGAEKDAQLEELRCAWAGA
jgi:hypothetical protein